VAVRVTEESIVLEETDKAKIESDLEVEADLEIDSDLEMESDLEIESDLGIALAWVLYDLWPKKGDQAKSPGKIPAEELLELRSAVNTVAAAFPSHRTELMSWFVALSARWQWRSKAPEPPAEGQRAASDRIGNAAGEERKLLAAVNRAVANIETQRQRRKAEEAGNQP
jgi:hypothetical protein